MWWLGLSSTDRKFYQLFMWFRQPQIRPVLISFSLRQTANVLFTYRPFGILSFWLIQFVPVHTIKTYRGSKLSFFASALEGGQWSTSHPDLFTPGKWPRYSLSRSLGGPHRWSGQFEEEKKYFAAVAIRTSDRPARSLVAILTMLSLSFFSSIFALFSQSRDGEGERGRREGEKRWKQLLQFWVFR